MSFEEDFRQTAARIANLPCNDSSNEELLRELSRWNNPGTGFTNTTSRFLTANSLTLPRPSLRNHPARILFKTIKAMASGTDRMDIKKSHWDEVGIDLKWRSSPTTRLLSDVNQQLPLYASLKRCEIGSERAKVGLDVVYSCLMHAAVHSTVNHILAASSESATLKDVEMFIGSSNLVRPIRQNTVDWHLLATPTARRTAVWTLAVACSMWGMEFVPSFLEFCTAALVGPICGISRDECKEGLAACVAVATVARARGHPILNQEILCCGRALWVLDVIERACCTAQGTLWASRYITKAKAPRVPTKASDKWESPIHVDLKPSSLFFVTGLNCTHAKTENKDGTYGEACSGRWSVVTTLEGLEQLRKQDPKMAVTLTHKNVQAAHNVLAVLERKGQWAYVQGEQECLNCAYAKALRHGFPVVVDSHQSLEVARTKGLTPFWWILFITITALSLVPYVTAEATVSRHLFGRSVVTPNATCEHFFGPPVRRVVSWKSLVSIIRALLSVVLTLGAIHSGKRFVRRTPFNLVTSIFSTVVSALGGWISTPGCAVFKSVAIMKGLVTASVNRLSYETVDLPSMVISVFGVVFTIIDLSVQRNYWALLQPGQIALICLSVSYLWRWLDTGMKQSTSVGVVGSPIPLFVSHVVALGLAVIAFMFNTRKDTTSAAASYVSDAFLIFEVVIQFLLLV